MFCRVLSDRAGLYPLEASITLQVSALTTKDVKTLSSIQSCGMTRRESCPLLEDHGLRVRVVALPDKACVAAFQGHLPTCQGWLEFCVCFVFSSLQQTQGDDSSCMNGEAKLQRTVREVI